MTDLKRAFREWIDGRVPTVEEAYEAGFALAERLEVERRAREDNPVVQELRAIARRNYSW